MSGHQLPTHSDRPVCEDGQKRGRIQLLKLHPRRVCVQISRAEPADGARKECGSGRLAARHDCASSARAIRAVFFWSRCRRKRGETGLPFPCACGPTARLYIDLETFSNAVPSVKLIGSACILCGFDRNPKQHNRKQHSTRPNCLMLAEHVPRTCHRLVNCTTNAGI